MHGVAPHMCGSRHLPIVRPRSRGSLPRLPNYSTLLFAYHVSQDDSSGGSARGIWAGGDQLRLMLIVGIRVAKPLKCRGARALVRAISFLTIAVCQPTKCACRK